MNGADELHAAFKAAGLPTPPIPDGMAANLRTIDEWCWATTDIEGGYMYALMPYPVEAVTRPVSDYVAVSHAGHGMNSYSINYHLVQGPLALFAQRGWGGVYMDAEKSTRKVAEMFGEIAELITTVERHLQEGWSRPGQLIVVESDFRRVGVCEWLEHPIGDEALANQWLLEQNRTEQALRTAIGWIGGLRP